MTKKIFFILAFVTANSFSQGHGSTEAVKVRLKFISEIRNAMDHGEFQIDQIMYECPSGKCVAFFRNRGNVDAFVPKAGEIEKVLEGNPQNKDDNGFLYLDPDSPLCQISDQKKSNCHAFAFSKFIELDPTQWISGFYLPRTGPAPPVATLTSEFFALKQSIQVSELQDSDFAKDANFVDGDLVQFRRGSGRRLVVLHSGRIFKKDGENWVISKLDGGPILVTPIRSLLNRYTEPSDKVEIYRFNGESKKQ